MHQQAARYVINRRQQKLRLKYENITRTKGLKRVIGKHAVVPLYTAFISCYMHLNVPSLDPCQGRIQGRNRHHSQDIDTKIRA